MNQILHPIPKFRELAGGISNTTVYKEIKEGRLEAVKVGARTFITDEAAISWLAKLKRGLGPPVAGKQPAAGPTRDSS